MAGFDVDFAVGGREVAAPSTSVRRSTVAPWSGCGEAAVPWVGEVVESAGSLRWRRRFLREASEVCPLC